MMQLLCNQGKLPEPLLEMSPRGWAVVTMSPFLSRTEQFIKFGQRDTCDEIIPMLPGLQQCSLQARGTLKAVFMKL